MISTQGKYHYMDSISHGDLIFYPSQDQSVKMTTMNMNISTFSLSSDPFEDRSSSMFNAPNTAFISTSDRIDIKGFHPDHSHTITTTTTTTSSDGYSISAQSASSGSSKDKKGQNRKIRAVGRGGVGNIINTDNLQVDYVDEADILRRRQLLTQFSPRAKISNTGRGGSGNILAASASTPYDRSKDPDDDYEKLIQLEARKKKMVSTSRGGAGNVQNHVVVDAGGGVRPRSKSLGIFSGSTTRKIKKPLLKSRPSTASTIARITSSDQYELEEYRLSPSTHRKKNIAPINLNTPSTTPTPLAMMHNGHSHNPTPTPIQPQRLAVSSAPPVKPVWKLQYQKPQQQPEPRRRPETETAKESTLHVKDKEKTGKGKWWKISKKSDDEEYPKIENAHTGQRLEPLHRHLRLHEIATDSLPQNGTASRHHPLYPTPNSSADGIPRISMRNHQIPSHIFPEQSTRSLSPVESILDEVRMLAESKAHRKGHFDMHDLEEILSQARHRHQITPAAYDPHGPPAQPPPSQLSQFPLPPPIAWRSSPQLRISSKQKLQRVHIREHPKRAHHRKEGMMDGDFIHPTHANTPPSPSYYLNPSPVYRVPSSTVSDVDISDNSSVERDTRSTSIQPLKESRRERQIYELPNEFPPTMHAAHTKSVIKQRSGSAIAYHDNGDQQYNRPSDVVSELHRRQLAVMAVHEEKNLQPVVDVADEGEGGSWSLDPVHEEDGDGLYLIEDEESYSSFIDL